MAQVKYHGEFPEGKDSIVQHGHEFTGNKAVEVTDKDLLAKFAGNRFFEVSGQSDKDELKKGHDDAEAAELETLQGWLADHKVPFHHREGLKSLRAKKAEYEASLEKAQSE